MMIISIGQMIYKDHRALFTWLWYTKKSVAHKERALIIKAGLHEALKSARCCMMHQKVADSVCLFTHYEIYEDMNGLMH